MEMILLGTSADAIETKLIRKRINSGSKKAT
jgi:hypothetical protein